MPLFCLILLYLVRFKYKPRHISNGNNFACLRFQEICLYFYLYKFFRERFWSSPPCLKIRHIRLQYFDFRLKSRKFSKKNSTWHPIGRYFVSDIHWSAWVGHQGRFIGKWSILWGCIEVQLIQHLPHKMHQMRLRAHLFVYPS